MARAMRVPNARGDADVLMRRISAAARAIDWAGGRFWRRVDRILPGAARSPRPARPARTDPGCGARRRRARHRRRGRRRFATDESFPLRDRRGRGAPRCAAQPPRAVDAREPGARRPSAANGAVGRANRRAFVEPARIGRRDGRHRRVARALRRCSPATCPSGATSAASPSATRSTSTTSTATSCAPLPTPTSSCARSAGPTCCSSARCCTTSARAIPATTPTSASRSSMWRCRAWASPTTTRRWCARWSSTTSCSPRPRPGATCPIREPLPTSPPPSTTSNGCSCCARSPRPTAWRRARRRGRRGSATSIDQLVDAVTEDLRGRAAAHRRRRRTRIDSPSCSPTCGGPVTAAMDP